MVKPNILTHVIEGFVIQEASEPFAVSCINLFMLGFFSQKKKLKTSGYFKSLHNLKVVQVKKTKQKQ